MEEEDSELWVNGGGCFRDLRSIEGPSTDDSLPMVAPKFRGGALEPHVSPKWPNLGKLRGSAGWSEMKAKIGHS